MSWHVEALLSGGHFARGASIEIVKGEKEERMVRFPRRKHACLILYIRKKEQKTQDILPAYALVRTTCPGHASTLSNQLLTGVYKGRECQAVVATSAPSPLSLSLSVFTFRFSFIFSRTTFRK